ncbi:MAG: tRNA (adenine-N1)-methyltransferase [Methanomassiliicoccales archaeon]
MLREGEIIYLLDDKGRRHFLTLSKDMVKIPGLGVIDGSKLVGAPEGSMLRLGDKIFHALRPGANELMESLERGPQVITPKDAAAIVFRLDLKPGDVVLESGVGSGSLTTALLNAVGSEGLVISVEMRSEFAAKARKNVSRSPFVKAWDLRIGNINEIRLEKELDAVALDVPEPWSALSNLETFLRPGGRFCAFVPNVNQLEQTVLSLRRRGYLEVEALEIMQRRMEVHPGGVRPAFESLGHTGYLIFARRALSVGKG